jgi:hypothetical protein
MSGSDPNVHGNAQECLRENVSILAKVRFTARLTEARRTALTTGVTNSIAFMDAPMHMKL